MPHSHYETDIILNEYLLFHYGTHEDQLPFPFGPKNSLHFPIRCVTECLDVDSLPSQAVALDLGCAVGRSSFELARYCEHVVAVDNSHIFISTAKHLQEKGRIEYKIIEEGAKPALRIAKLPEKIDPTRVHFRCCDAMNLFQEPVRFHVVLAANLLCRLPHPASFLKQLPSLVEIGGQLILTSPYSWLEEFTPKSHWLGEGSLDQKTHLKCIKDIFMGYFELERSFDMPFLMREHLRKYQWGVAQASTWKRTINK
jgi:putative 4-mercaptohistidine N1-methyltranferase